MNWTRLRLTVSIFQCENDLRPHQHFQAAFVIFRLAKTPEPCENGQIFSPLSVCALKQVSQPTCNNELDRHPRQTIFYGRSVTSAFKMHHSHLERAECCLINFAATQPPPVSRQLQTQLVTLQTLHSASCFVWPLSLFSYS